MKANQIPFYIVSCDKTAWILKAFSHLANKFWNRKYDVLGFKKCPELPDNFSFISMAEKQKSVNLWTKYIYDYIKIESSEFVFFGLDDYLFIDSFKEDIFNKVFDRMQNDSNIVRYELGYGSSRKTKLPYIGKHVIKYNENTPYRVSCQISLWRTKYLLKILNHNWTPWEFEIKGSQLSNFDGTDIISTIDKYALRWIEESALSKRHPGMINILGLKHSLVNELIDLNYIDKNKLQYGMPKGKAETKFNPTLPGKKYNEFY